MAYPTLKGHIEIARFDHWFKNVFVIPGVFAALLLAPDYQGADLIWRLIAGLVAIGMVASSNYVINEVLDAPYDRQHPVKCHRPVPSGRVHIPIAYAQWLVMMVAGIGLGSTLSFSFAVVLAVLWGMGCVYNIRPVRSKDLPYIDVLTEAVNNPLRMLAGWFMASSALVPPASLLVSYWMIGCYFMTMKRFAEYRDLKEPALASAYRKSFAFYTEQRLLVAVMFYGSAAMLFFGAFIVRYRLELIVSFPFVALVMAVYLALAFKEDSAVQRPEGLYREPLIMAPVIACSLIMVLLWMVDIPFLHRLFAPTAAIH
ncbi:UbiA prenyltransferase family protein [Candidatus Entotheonella palauensis]|uniref:UbiA prenyltransferase family protein n=1 Tax=Candidatus Entotheonella palauensis TaxID=93172 RepID=UPI000B7FEF46|nr:UbiA prenyltransferase family protein [Candidatus Entotheonella palauensis]